MLNSPLKVCASGVFQQKFAFCQTPSRSRSWDHGFLTHAEVAKRFEEFDTDKDGLITVSECRAAMSRLDREISDGLVRESIWAWDHNGDGMVDYFEFMDYFLRTAPDEHAHDPNTEFDSIDDLLQHCTVKDDATVSTNLSRQAKLELIESFKLLDLDKDGFLDKNELKAALRTMSPKTPAAQLEETLANLFARADKNSDGLIDLYEFSTRVVQQGLYA